MPRVDTQHSLHFYRHVNGSSSERIASCLSWDGLEKANSVQTLLLQASASQALPSPSALAVNDILSVTISCMKFQTYTRCHHLGLSVEDIDNVWFNTIVHSGYEMFHCGYVSAAAISARAILVGAFVERLSSSHFRVGIITQRPRVDSAVLQIIQHWCSFIQQPFAGVTLSSELPMCKLQRHATMKVWVEQEQRHIHVGQQIPAIHVQVTNTVLQPVLVAHDRVKLFLTRPANAVLLGTLSQQLHHATAHQTLCHTASLTRDGHGPAASATMNYSPKECITFRHVSVSDHGETLIGVECTVRDEYRPFVSSLSEYIAPFLVLDAQQTHGAVRDHHAMVAVDLRSSSRSVSSQQFLQILQ